MRFSILTLLGLVAVAAVGCAALLNANEMWASIVGTLVFVVVLSGVIASVYRSGSNRAFSIGFALFGVAHFCADSIAPLSHLLTEPISTLAWAYIDGATLETDVGEVGTLDFGFHARPVVAGEIYCGSVIHSLLTLVFAILGGLIARYFYWLRQKQEAAIAEQSR